MKDMLVRLLELPETWALEAKLLEKENILFRKAIAPEKHLVSAWVKEHFGAYWQSEVEVAFSRQPVSCWIAQRGNWILGFACYESTARNFFRTHWHFGDRAREGNRQSSLGKISGITPGNGLRLRYHRWSWAGRILRKSS